jgi:predicted nucleotidyltransferase
MESKEDKVLELFFNSTKHWHFDVLLKKSGLSRSRLAFWLKRFTEKGMIKRVKAPGKMPYYVQVFENLTFRSEKRLFALKQLTDAGLINHLSSLPKAQVVVLFGSFSRWDWYSDSDIDIFIYGKDDGFMQGKYERLLNREIQVHLFRNKAELQRKSKLLPYILSGDFIKGSIDELGVDIIAKT